MQRAIKIAAIGDCCIDIYPQEHKQFLGGTAFNVAANVAKAGAKASILSAIGNDQFRKMYLTACKKCDIDTTRLAILQGETSHVDIALDNIGKQEFSNWELGVLAKYKLTKSDKTFLQIHDAARIVLLKPLTELFDQFAQMQFPKTLKVADFAGASMYSEGTAIIKKYVKHFDILIKGIENEQADEAAFFKELAYDYPEKIFLATLGKNGSMVFADKTIYKQSATKTTVIDTNGAGDTYTAYFLITYLLTKNIPKAMQAGTKAAAKTIRHIGATSFNQMINDG